MPAENATLGEDAGITPPPKAPIYTQDVILARVVQVGDMLVLEGKTAHQIYRWNMEPEQLAKGWGYTMRHIRAMVTRARKMGRSLLARDYEETILTALKGWYDIRRNSILLGDMKAAVVAQDRIDRLRGAYILPNKGPLNVTPTDEKPAIDWGNSGGDYRNELPPPEAQEAEAT